MRKTGKLDGCISEVHLRTPRGSYPGVSGLSGHDHYGLGRPDDVVVRRVISDGARERKRQGIDLGSVLAPSLERHRPPEIRRMRHSRVPH